MPGEIKIEITYNPVTGQIKVNSTADSKVLVYGVIEAAKDAVQEMFMKGAPPLVKSDIIIPLPALVPPNRRRGRL